MEEEVTWQVYDGGGDIGQWRGLWEAVFGKMHKRGSAMDLRSWLEDSGSLIARNYPVLVLEQGEPPWSSPQLM